MGNTPLSAVQRTLITGNGFRAHADHIVEQGRAHFSTKKVKPRDTIYVEVDYSGYFFEKVFPKIKVPIILITHNGDHSAPNKYFKYLDDPKIIAWFGQNCDRVHPKFIPIPIGIANPKWEHGNQQIFHEVMNGLVQRKNHEKKFSMYMNFSPSTNPIRQQVYNFFIAKDFVTWATVKPLRNYLQEMGQYTFVVSPFGNGLDCHRTWEALLVGAIPVVTSSTLDQLYEDLPVIIVQNWTEVTREFLEAKYAEMATKTFNFEKLFLEYWLAKIDQYKKQ